MQKTNAFKILLLTLLSVPLVLHAEIIEMRGWEIDTQNLSSENILRITRLMKNMDNIIHTYTVETTRKAAKNKCSITFAKPENLRAPIEIGVKNQTIVISLASDPLSWESDYEVLKKLVELNIMNKYNMLSTANYKFPSWISTALTRKFIRKNEFISLPGLSTYPNIRFLAMHNALNSNSLFSIFNGQLKPEDGGLFVIYAEACEILLDACYKISTAEENLIAQTILLSLKNSSNEEEAFRMNIGTVVTSQKILYFIKTEGLPEKAVLGMWFRNQLEESAMGTLIPANDEYTEKLFKQALTVYYHIKDGEKTEIKNAGLPMIESDFDKIEDKKILFSDIIKGLSAVKNKIPFAFHASISKIIEAVSLLETGSPKGFADKIKAAEQDFATVLKERQAMNKYMTAMERKYLPPVMKHYSRLQIIEEEQDRHRLTAPLLEIYLDKLEKTKLD